MIIEIIFAILVPPLLYFLYYYIEHILQLKNYPPGPFPLPVIGNLHLMSMKPYLNFNELAKKYGNVFSMSFGMERVVILNTIEPAREALITKSNQFAGRPSNHYTANMLSRGCKDIAFADYGPVWKLTRKLGHLGLKMYGDGLGNLEKKINLETEELFTRLNKMQGEPADLQDEFGLAVLNIICSMVFGKRYNIDDSEFRDVIRMNNLLVKSFNNGDPVAFLPWLRFFPMKNFQTLKEYMSLRDNFLSKKLMEHKQSFDPSNIRDFTDALLKSASQKEVWEDVGVGEVTDDHLEMIIFDIFSAGAETTLTTLRWSVVFLLHWPKYQDEIYEEIINIIGTNREPELKDRPLLPLVSCAIRETLRLSSLVPLGVPHKSTEATSINGCAIPKDTQIFFNLWNYHHDERYWKEPNVFNPHRWLDEQNNYAPGSQTSFLPFSAGRRVCLGETMAKTELFLFFSRLIRNFKIEPNLEEPLPNLEGQISVTMSPFPFSARFIPREHLK